MVRTLIFAALIAAPVGAQLPDGFATGPRIDDFGPHAPIEQATPVAADESIRHSFDVADAADPGELSRGFESVARFLNMLAAAGHDPSMLDVAVVVHGGATLDLLSATAYAERKDGADNASLALITALQAEGVRIILCGQSAAANGVAADQLLPGIEMALSAMTAHARLQQDGYSVNPF